ncbi:uncharacterized protein PV07_12546 [Cladophialophora immunda]|uniref:Protein kinase domain-containing protein n=1 Tax=Cladophialophora immunda TaxID=569365 RepID=A0A0D2CEU9_9EURO|nr:uncharacterized protein PV07_12546 [Cladophialophora immunda]KIW22054.1 hypothetical protein PV07_12546 [Cladophialophora immunda]
MGPPGDVDKASLKDTIRLDDTNDTIRLDDTNDTIRLDDTNDTIRLDDTPDSTRQLDDIHDPARQLNDTIRVENRPDSSVVPVTWSLPPTSSDFARLVPVNHQAKIAFHEIATILKTDGCWNPHCRKFIHVSDVKSKVISGRSKESDTSDGDTETQEIYTGYFRLNLSILPDKFPQGWIIGAGRSGMDHLGVDFLLTIKGNRDRVRGRHASIKHHKVSRHLMIAPAPGKGAVLNGEEVPTDGRVLESVRMGLTIGNLTFKIEFLPTNVATYNEQLDEIVRESGTWFTERIESIDPTPSDNHLILQGYQIQTPQAFGAYGVVSPCVNTSSGNVYAVKRIQRTQSSFDQIGDEIAILKLLEKHPHICALTEVIYSDGDDSSMGNRRINDVYMIFEPWAPRTLHALMASQVSPSIRWRAFHQGAQGIRYFHSFGVIHRDLKFGNILVVQLDPLRVVITDFGHATTFTNSQDHMKGTISYLPPEIIELKEKSNDPKRTPPDPALRWSCKSDVYSYGLVGWALRHGYFKRPVDGIDKIVHKGLLATLQNSRTAADEVLEDMLAWDSDSRLEMREVLLKPCWSEPETPCIEKKRIFPG